MIKKRPPRGNNFWDWRVEIRQWSIIRKFNTATLAGPGAIAMASGVEAWHYSKDHIKYTHVGRFEVEWHVRTRSR